LSDSCGDFSNKGEASGSRERVANDDAEASNIGKGIPDNNNNNTNNNINILSGDEENV
jgi:hypothetical protein